MDLARLNSFVTKEFQEIGRVIDSQCRQKEIPDISDAIADLELASAFMRFGERRRQTILSIITERENGAEIIISIVQRIYFSLYKRKLSNSKRLEEITDFVYLNYIAETRLLSTLVDLQTRLLDRAVE